MAKINLKGMSRKELEKLQADIEKQMARVVEDEKKAALVAAEKAAKDLGFTLQELAGMSTAKPARKKSDGRSKVAPKFANPEDPSQTWTGRGRKPKWVEAHLANGGTLEEVTI